MKPQDKEWLDRLGCGMPSAEAGQYDLSLPVEDCGRTASEAEMERKLGEMLARPAPGADAAWQTALARVKEHEQTRRAQARWRRFAWAAAPVALAAMALVMFSVGYGRTQTQPSFLSVSTRDARAPLSTTRTREVMASARNLLRDHDMRVALDPKNALEAADAPCRLVSVRGAEHGGEPVVEMVFLYGGKPAKVVITNASGSAAHEISRAAAGGATLASRAVGDWLVTAVGTGAPEGLLSLIEEAPPEPQEQAPVQAAETPPTETPVPEAAPATPEGVPDSAVVTQDTAIVTLQSAPEAAVTPPQSASEDAQATPEAPVSPASAAESQVPAQPDPPEQANTSI